MISSKFLGRLFSEAEFPAPVGDHIVDRYAHRYRIDIALNLELCRPELFGHEVDEETVCMLLCSSRDNVLNAVLDTDECRDRVLYGILAIYGLSDADQMRFAKRNMSSGVAEKALDDYLSFPPARTLLLQHTTRTEDSPIRRLHGYIPRETTKSMYPSSGRFPRQIKDVCAPIDMPLNDIDYGGAAHLGTFLSQALGDGVSDESLRQWEAFFVLVPTAGDVTLKTVIRTAKTLVYANK